MLDRGEQEIYDEGRQATLDKAAERQASRETIGARLTRTIRNMARTAFCLDHNPGRKVPIRILDAADADNEAIDRNLALAIHYEELVESNKKNIGYDIHKMAGIGEEFQHKADRCRQIIDQIKTPATKIENDRQAKTDTERGDYFDHRIGSFLKVSIGKRLNDKS